MGKYADLLQRVKAATGPDRVLDLAIHCLMFPTDDITKIATGHWNDQRDWGLTDGSVWNRTEFGSASIPMPRYTASVDAALALVERILGHAATVEPIINIGAAEHTCTITLFERDEEPFVAEGLRSPSLAILAALLQALEATDA